MKPESVEDLEVPSYVSGAAEGGSKASAGHNNTYNFLELPLWAFLFLPFCLIR